MKDLIRKTVAVMLFCTALGTGIVVVDRWTGPVIQNYRQQRLRSLLLEGFGIPHDEKSSASIFETVVKVRGQGEHRHYITSDSQPAFTFETIGLIHRNRGVVVLETDRKTIRSIMLEFRDIAPGDGLEVAAPALLRSLSGRQFDPFLQKIAGTRKSATRDLQPFAMSHSEENIIASLNTAYRYFREAERVTVSSFSEEVSSAGLYYIE